MPFGYEGEYVLIGPPGTGKTTTLKKQVEKIVGKAAGMTFGNNSPVIVSSLTRTAAAEVAGRDLPLPKEAVATIHSHGYRAMGCPPVVDDDSLPEWNSQNPAWALSTSGAGGGTADDLSGEAAAPRRGSPGVEVASEYHLYRHRMVPREDWPFNVKVFADAWERWKDKRGLIDYSDMIELAPDEPPLGAGVVLCDEAQDCSALEFDLLNRWGRKAGAIIAVGDPYQSLYHWRGATPERLLEAQRRRVLAQSYRVPRGVHGAAMAWLGRLSRYEPIEYRPRDFDGLVSRCPATLNTPRPAIQMARRFVEAGETAMFITTCNYQTTELTAALRAAGLPFANPWRAKSNSWNPLGKVSKTSTAAMVAAIVRPSTEGRLWTVGELDAWAPLVSGLFKNGAKARIRSRAEFGDEHQRLTVGDLLEYCKRDRLGPLVDAMDGGADHVGDWLLGNVAASRSKAAGYVTNVVKSFGADAVAEPPRIYVGTAHSFKGAEADHVFVFPDLSRVAGKGWHAGGGADYDGIVRTLYVAMTRAKKSLYLCASDSRDFVDWAGVPTTEAWHA